jgi:hypothetical protein
MEPKEMRTKMKSNKGKFLRAGSRSYSRRYVIRKCLTLLRANPSTLYTAQVVNDPLLCWYLTQVKILNMVSQVRHVAKGASRLLMWKPLISNAKDAFALVIDGGKDREHGDSFLIRYF